jgi:SAM-dependent methyltransferase
MSVDPKTLAVYDARATDYATKFDGGTKPGKHLARFITAMPAGGSVLDLGCGPGGAAAHMARAGLIVDAVDASTEMVRVADEINGVMARVATFDDVDADAIYDGVWANFSLLHATREALTRHLAAIARALKSAGLFHIGMKTGTGAARDQIERLYTYVGDSELTGLLATAGFEIMATDTGCDIGLAGTDDPWIVHLSRKT